MIAAGDGMLWGAEARRTLHWQRVFTKQLPGQFYQGITNGYDMICLASFLIKACLGNVAATAPHLTEGSVMVAECRPLLEALILEAIKVPLWLHKGEWPLARPIRCVAWLRGGGDREGNKSSSSDQPTSHCDKD